VHEWIFLRQLNPGIQLRRPIAVPNRNHGPNSSRARPLNYLLAIGIELLAIKMRMRINKHKKSSVDGVPLCVPLCPLW
jgi:hypothetical protein